MLTQCTGWVLVGVVLLGSVTCDNHGEGEVDTKTWGDCTEAPERGSCSDFEVRWYYNESEGFCKRFWFGGCDEKANNFKTEEQCNSYCKPNTKGTENIKIGVDDAKVNVKEKPQANPEASEICKMEKPLQSLCTEWQVKWFYNSDKEICDRFWFGGCEGGGNKFESEEECQKSCQSISEEDVCGQPVVTGRCRARHPRWYYNKERRECLEFVYGGCDGNGNRFRSKADCERTCLSGTSALGDETKDCQNSRYGCCPDRKTPARGPYNEGCPSACQSTYYGCCDDDVTPATGPNQEGCETIEISSGVDDCAESQYGCCPDGITAATGRDNEGCPSQPDRISPTVAPDITVDVAAQCREPKEVGPCRTNPEVMWYYDTAEQRCLRFWYGGCQGNNNRFKSEKECLTTCQNMVQKEVTPRPGSEVPVCEQPKEIGPCKALLPRFFYNKETASCEEFMFGGCRGNNNNFKSESECLRYCQRRAPEPTETPTRVPVCEQPREVGPCRAQIPRWSYNKAIGLCEEFNYGGCQGNNNNFESLAECQRYCRRGTPVAKPGTCPSFISQGDNETCTSSCRYDGECPGNTKCCPNENNCYLCVDAESNTGTETVVTAEEVCNLDYVVGFCRAGIPRFYYNRNTRKCDSFTYGGCGGNRNNFRTMEACQTYCGVREEKEVTETRTNVRQSVCSLAPSRGPCERSVTKYFYNQASMQCETFTYGGCLGNHNNFETEAKCSQYCGLRQGSSWKDTCQLSKETGTCRGNFRRWYYDSRQGRCFEFTYGGCQGNGNNFADERTCQSTCSVAGPVVRPVRPVRPVTPEPTVAPPREEDVCSLDFKPTSQCNFNGANSSWYYDKSTGMCSEIAQGECNSNRNNFQSYEQCERYCSRERVCQPLTYSTTIRCLALIPRWTYDSRSRSCESFSYGGCGGSANNFDSKEACDRKCDPGAVEPVTRAPEPLSRSEICAQPESAGNCLAYMRNWRYDSLTGQCVQFTFGGCGGNKNNFDSREECENFCSRPVVCQAFEEPDVSCLAYYSRWRFDPASRQCENFVYGGCGGNANNFETFESCENKCITDDRVEPVDTGRTDNRGNTWREICNLQADVGPCKQYNRRWHYNSISQSCEEFTYGGCLGNHNNFESDLQCMKYCDPSRIGGQPEVPYEGSGETGEEITPAPKSGVDVCALDSETGPCKAFLRQWYYNSVKGQCMMFSYGGCRGNGNRFSTREECEAQCSPREVCLLPQQSGNCMIFVPRWFFDYGEQKCKEFVYGGCDGNANNFESQEVCEQRCSSLIRTPDVTDVATNTTTEEEYSNLYNTSSETESNSTCMDHCSSDQDCEGDKICFTLGCNSVCVAPESRLVPPGPPSGEKSGYCPPRTDWQGLLGACAPTCRDDSGCQGYQKCCHHGCGFKCVDPVSEEPYQMDAPMRILADTQGEDAIYLTWADPSLGSEQLIRDNRYYTIRYHNYREGQYNYMNVTDLRARVNGLRSDTEYEFAVRANNPPYLSQWSEITKNKTQAPVVSKLGSCPVLADDQVGICVNDCNNDGDCSGAQKCCSNGCGQTCQDPEGYDICSLQSDAGSCAEWEVRWFFSTEKQRCDRFWYGGCNEGNGNNFKDEEACKAQCDGGSVIVTTETPVYDCRRTRYGCCNDGYTTAVDSQKSNCEESQPYDCRRSIYGCCADQYTTATDATKSNCPENQQGSREITIPAQPGESVIIDCRQGEDVTWYRNGKLVTSNDRLKVNSDGTIEVFNAAIDDDGIYACHVTRDFDRTTIYRYVLQVQVPIGILPGPDEIQVKPNHLGFLHCEVYGNPRPSVTWERYGRTIQPGQDYEMFSNGTLLVYKAGEDNEGEYTCTANNNVSPPVSRNIQLVLREMLVARIENDNGRVMEGSRIMITCEGRGYPQPTVTWEKMGRPLTTQGRVYISETGRLVVQDVTTNDSGVYTCIVANSAEKIETSTSVQVVPKSMVDDKCVDRTSLMKCRLIVTARLCGYTMYSKICCNSCNNYFRNGE